MLALTHEQLDCLEAIALERGTRRVTAVLTQAFPLAASRAGERFEAAVSHGIEKAAGHGLLDALCVARYIGCWFALGAEFEAKPGFEWAAIILGGAGRHQGAKAFQLCKRVSEEVKQRPRTSGTDDFAAGVVMLDAELTGYGPVGSFRPAAAVRLGAACDIDAIDVRVIDNGWRQHYNVVGGNWLRAPIDPGVGHVTLAAQPSTAAESVAALPKRLALLSGLASRREGVRLRLRVRASACCDPQVHPMISLNGSQGLMHWRGAMASEVTLPLYAAPNPPPLGDALEPAIAAEASPTLALLDFASCGLRDRGVPLGDLNTQLEVFPAEQLLLSWSREPAGEMAWPDAGAAPPPPPAARCRLERDGMPLNLSRWQAGLSELDRQLAAGLSSLLVAWERESRVSRGRVTAEPAVMTGTAGLTWGWADGPMGIVDPPWMRVEALVDLVACRLKLVLTGQLDVDGSRSLLSLQCNGETKLSSAWKRAPTDGPLAASLAALQVEFKHPFELHVEPLAHEGHATLTATGGATGALVGRCGLRQSSSGPGLEWFANLAIEPVAAKFVLHDPLFGRMQQQRPLLPAVQLLDWSLG